MDLIDAITNQNVRSVPVKSIFKSLNRRMCIKSESHKICVAGNQCDNSDFDFHNAKHKELPVIKVSSDEGREDCQQLKPKGTQASLGITVIAVTIIVTAIAVINYSSYSFNFV